MVSRLSIRTDIKSIHGIHRDHIYIPKFSSITNIINVFIWKCEKLKSVHIHCVTSQSRGANLSLSPLGPCLSFSPPNKCHVNCPSLCQQEAIINLIISSATVNKLDLYLSFEWCVSAHWCSSNCHGCTTRGQEGGPQLRFRSGTFLRDDNFKTVQVCDPWNKSKKKKSFAKCTYACAVEIKERIQ